MIGCTVQHPHNDQHLPSLAKNDNVPPDGPAPIYTTAIARHRTYARVFQQKVEGPCNDTFISICLLDAPLGCGITPNFDQVALGQATELY
jgi:hypothetical protein